MFLRALAHAWQSLWDAIDPDERWLVVLCALTVNYLAIGFVFGAVQEFACRVGAYVAERRRTRAAIDLLLERLPKRVGGLR
jgi:hypothetical protein